VRQYVCVGYAVYDEEKLQQQRHEAKKSPTAPVELPYCEGAHLLWPVLWPGQPPLLKALRFQRLDGGNRRIHVRVLSSCLRLVAAPERFLCVPVCCCDVSQANCLPRGTVTAQLQY